MVLAGENFMNAYNSGAEQDIMLTFEDGSVIGKSDISITSGGLTISEYLNSDEDYTIGAASMAELKVTLINKDGKFDNFNFAQNFTLNFGVKVGDTFQYMPMGYWIGERPEKVKSRLIQFTAYDFMKAFDVSAERFILQQLTFPITLQDMLKQLLDFVGTPSFSKSTSLPVNASKSFSGNPFDSADYTCREVLAMIAEAGGGYARIRYEYGAYSYCMKVGVQNFTAVDHTIERTGRFELAVSDFPTPSISKLEVYTSYSDMLTTAGTGSNTYVIADNPLLYIENDTEVEEFQPYVDALYDELSAFPEYYPASVRAVGVPWIECGDIIKVIDDNGNALDFPIFAKTMTWNGSWMMELENTGGVMRQVIPIEQRELQNLKKKMLQTTDLYTEIDSYLSSEEGIASINSAVGGKFVTQDDISGFVTESQLDTSIEQYINGAEGQASIVSAVSGQFMEKPVEPVYSTPSGVTYGFSKTSDGYYTSTNAGVDDSFSYGKFTFNSPTARTITLRCISYGEDNYDYGLISVLNAELSQSNTADSSNVLHNFKGESSAEPVDISLDIPAGESFITFKYRKDGSTREYGDYFKIMVVGGEFATTAEVSATIEQKIDAFEAGIKLTAVANGNTGTFTLTSGTATLSTAQITFSGFVTFTDLSMAGQTTINGANITTGTISADRIDASTLNIKNVYYLDNDSVTIITSGLDTEHNATVKVGIQSYIGSTDAVQCLEFFATDFFFVKTGTSWTDNTTLRIDTNKCAIAPQKAAEWIIGLSDCPFDCVFSHSIELSDEDTPTDMCALYYSNGRLYAFGYYGDDSKIIELADFR